VIVLASIQQLVNLDWHRSDQDGCAEFARALEEKGQDRR